MRLKKPYVILHIYVQEDRLQDYELLQRLGRESGRRRVDIEGAEMLNGDLTAGFLDEEDRLVRHKEQFVVANLLSERIGIIKLGADRKYKAKDLIAYIAHTSITSNDPRQHHPLPVNVLILRKVVRRASHCPTI